jgi:serine/threonine-protein kinase
MELGPGASVTNNVRLVRKLGEGGMGSVWVADHLTLETQVAVKFISAALSQQDPTLLERFRQEAKAAAKIRSPYVVQTFDQGVTPDGMAYIVMELLDGESLGDRLERAGAVPLGQIAQIVDQVAKALQVAHQLGIVHRDIKPDNVFLTKAGDELLVKVLDFGIAKQTGEAAKQAMTHTGAFLGSPAYMSPEQLLFAKEVDSRADLWALGVVVYEALTGRCPFHGETLTALSMAICHARYAPPSELGAGVHPGFDAWFRRAFALTPEQRFGSAKELADSLRRIIEEALAAGGVAAVPAPVSGLDATASGEYVAVAAPTAAASASGYTPALGHTEVAAPAAADPLVAAPPAVGSAQPQLAPTFGGASATVGRAGAARRSPVGLIALGVLGVLVLGGTVITAVRWSLPSGDEPVAAATAKPSGEPGMASSADGPVATATAIAEALTPPPAGMVAIAGGEYWIGCDEQANRGCQADEKPGFVAKLDRFAITVHEITMQQYDQCAATGSCPAVGLGRGCTWQNEGKERQPINCASWHAARAYCAAKGWRLPTEQEWEAAARGAERLSFPWGSTDATCEVTVLADPKPGCGTGGPLPVGSRPRDRSWIGALDMGGNVREWTASQHAPYAGAAGIEPREGVVVKGGSYSVGVEEMPRAHTRAVELPNEQQADLGFRCAVSL